MTFQYARDQAQRGSNRLLFDSPADWISPNPDADGGYDYRTDPPPTQGAKVVLSDTDHLWGIGGNPQWVWKSFCRGLTPIFMDPYNNRVLGKGAPEQWQGVRRSLGHTRRLAERVDLAALKPREDLASTKYCLAQPGVAYIVYLSGGGEVMVDLSAASGTFQVEWVHPVEGTITVKSLSFVLIVLNCAALLWVICTRFNYVRLGAAASEPRRRRRLVHRRDQQQRATYTYDLLTQVFPRLRRVRMRVQTKDVSTRKFCLFCVILALICALVSTVEIPAAAKNQRASARSTQSLRLPRIPGIKPRNVIFILADDHRYDALGFLQGQAFLSAPQLDAMARSGVHLRNAFVTTALCSPSRASILTGLYAHQHRVVDNDNPVSPDLVFFPQYLQKAGYETAFIGKWHMGGESDDPQRGFDHWVSFKGQGTYLPSNNGLNVNGQRVPQKGYITDELTDYAIDWLDGGKGDRPFMLYLSHKAVHSGFVPAEPVTPTGSSSSRRR